MCHTVCFEAGRFTQIQSSWTASSCSRKWMSGPAGTLADAWAEFVTDRPRQIAGQEDVTGVDAGSLESWDARALSSQLRSIVLQRGESIDLVLMGRELFDPGSRLTLVMRIRGIRFHPSARIAPLERGKPI